MASQEASELPRARNRPPAPALFIRSMSGNMSSQSLLPPNDRLTPPRAAGLARQTSARGAMSKGDPRTDAVMSPAGAELSSPLSRRQPPEKQQAQQRNDERTEAKWVEMQNTLEELQLSAAAGVHVFGADHSKALDELRTAQIALAQAWARSEADEDTLDDALDMKVSDEAEVKADVLSSDKGDASRKGRERSGTNFSTKSQLEEETENDITMARKRREANDRYFRKVNAGVKDVVAKLEEVANAMKGVELESKEIWDRDSIEDGSVTG